MSVGLEHIEYLLFDHDGVLVDTEYWYFLATKRAMSELGVELSLEDYRQHLVDGSGSWRAALEHGVAETAVTEARQRRNEYYQQFLRTESIDIEGVETALEKLSKRFRMAIVTTSKREDFELIHKDREITRHMDFVLCNGDYPRAKPQPDPYLTALSKFNTRHDKALVIEDSERGLRAAVAAEIPCITIYNEFTAHQDFSAGIRHIQRLGRIGSAALLTNLVDRFLCAIQ